MVRYNEIQKRGIYGMKKENEYKEKKDIMTILNYAETKRRRKRKEEFLRKLTVC